MSIKKLYWKTKRDVLAAFAATCLFTIPIKGEAADPFAAKVVENSNQWKKFHSVQGKCCVDLPVPPEHIKQNVALPDEEYTMQYDVYLANLENRAVYMMLVAQYPDFIDDSFAELSLESFLNGILNQNASNQLVFADLLDFQGFKAMDFFIRTNNVFFKGRAIMAKNFLYLLAMECETKNYQEIDFKHFINSFELVP